MHQDNFPESENPADHLQWRNIQANYSAMMYILTEQQALIAQLLDELIKAGVIDAPGLARITGVYGNAEALNPVYDDIYKRFATYFIRVKDVLENPEQYQPQSPFPEEPVNDGREDSDDPRREG